MALLRIIFFSLCALGLVGTSSGALAQGGAATEAAPGRGAYVGYTFGVGAFLGAGAALELGGQVGFEKLLFGLDLRTGLGLVAKDAPALKVSGDALYNLAPGIYLGGGPRLVFGRAFDVGVGALATINVASEGHLSLFAEPGLDVYFLGATQLVPRLSLGLRRHF